MIAGETKTVILRQFEINDGQVSMDDATLFQVLADQIAYMLEYRFEFLMSLMYRLDIEEREIHLALAPDSSEPANIALARLVIDRQVKRMQTKEKYKQDPIPGWDAF